MLTNKEVQLLTFLLNQQSWTTSSRLSANLDLSKRSISNYISRINCRYPLLIISSNKGYRVSKENAIDILNEISTEWIPDNYENRKKYILEKILLSRESLSMESLSERLCISFVTLQNELSRLRNDLSDYELLLRIRNNKLSIIGPENKKRRLVLNLINEELETAALSLERMQDLFVEVDLKKVKEIIIQSLKKHDYFLDDYSLLNYILHVAVFIELKENRGSLSEILNGDGKVLREIVSPHVYQIIEDIFDDLVIAYPAYYEPDDFFEASLPMMTNAVSNRISKLSVDQLPKFVSDEVYELLRKIVNDVKDTYSIDLDEDYFLIRFAFHLKNAIIRLQNNIRISHNQFVKIKKDFPLIYVIAVFISKIINNKTGYTLSEDEIAYIALHIGAIMEEKKAYSEKINCIVLSPEYQTVNRTLYKRLVSSFSESLIISNFIASIDDISPNDQFDLLLSTIEINPIEIDPDICLSYLQIDPFLSDLSIKNIYQKIDDLKKLKIRKSFLDKFRYFFHEDIFFYNQPYKTHRDAIESMCDELIRLNYVDESFKFALYEHEEVAPSAYGNIAIPHPLTPEAKSSFIAISINPNPINWYNNKVNLVFMISLEEKNRGLFKEIFDFIAHLISNPEFYSKIMDSKIFDIFIDTLVSYAVD